MRLHQVVRSVSRVAAQGCIVLATVGAEAEQTTEEGSRGMGAAMEPLTRFETNVEKRRWYGWQVLATSGTGAIALSISMWKALDGKSIPEAIYEPLIGLYVGGGPTVHWAHGEGGNGFVSLALNVGFPLAAATIGLGALPILEYLVKGECNFGLAENLDNLPSCRWYWATPYLLTAGLLAAPAFDAAFFAYSHPEPSHSAFAVAPLVSHNWQGQTALVGWMSTWTFSP